MSRQRRRDAVPELELRRALRALGLGYRVNAVLPGLPRRRCDVMFKGVKVVVFVDGCFWHGCPEHSTAPRNNADWWARKLSGNRARDRDTDRHMMALGWTVIRVWEHQDMTAAAGEISDLVRGLRGEGPHKQVP